MPIYAVVTVFFLSQGPPGLTLSLGRTAITRVPQGRVPTSGAGNGPTMRLLCRLLSEPIALPWYFTFAENIGTKGAWTQLCVNHTNGLDLYIYKEYKHTNSTFTYTVGYSGLHAEYSLSPKHFFKILQKTLACQVRPRLFYPLLMPPK